MLKYKNLKYIGSKNMRKCTCGNDKFYAHQACYLDVIVDGDNHFEDNAMKTAEESVYESDDPYGPYTCTKCGKEYDEVEDIPEC